VRLHGQKNPPKLSSAPVSKTNLTVLTWFQTRFGRCLRISNMCLKQLHRKSLKRIWGKCWPCKHTLPLMILILQMILQLGFAILNCKSIFYLFNCSYWDWILVKVLRAQTHRAVHCVPGWCIWGALLMVGDVVFICYWTCSRPEYSGK